MRIRLLVPRVSDTESWVPGDEITVSDAEAHRMIDAEQAVPVSGKANAKRAGKTVETTAADPGAEAR
jgi:hypothetical protein